MERINGVCLDFALSLCPTEECAARIQGGCPKDAWEMCDSVLGLKYSKEHTSPFSSENAR